MAKTHTIQWHTHIHAYMSYTYIWYCSHTQYHASYKSYFIFREISKELEGATFSVPIGEVGFLIIITVIASILASVIPANEASKIYPAEALRYE